MSLRINERRAGVRALRGVVSEKIRDIAQYSAANTTHYAVVGETSAAECNELKLYGVQPLEMAPMGRRIKSMVLPTNEGPYVIN